MRIQYELNDDEWEQVSRYISTEKRRHDIGKEALFEWCTRREGRDKKLITDRRIKDIKELTPIIIEILKNLGVIK